MEAKELVLKSLEESQASLSRTLDGLTQEEIAWSPGPECNSIAFTLWHITRVEEFWVNRVIRREPEVYETEGWQEKLATPAKEVGYQYTAQQLQAWPVPKLADLRGYANSVREKTMAFLKSIPNDRLSKAARPDRSPDTIGSILSHLITEIAMHVGQIAYLRGVQRGLDK